jgi:hypothetical protein
MSGLDDPPKSVAVHDANEPFVEEQEEERDPGLRRGRL